MVYPILSARRATSRSPRCSCPHPLSHIATSKARMCERARPSPSAIPWHLDGSWGLENSSFLWLLVVQVIIGIELLIGGWMSWTQIGWQLWNLFRWACEASYQQNDNEPQKYAHIMVISEAMCHQGTAQSVLESLKSAHRYHAVLPSACKPAFNSSRSLGMMQIQHTGGAVDTCTTLQSRASNWSMVFVKSAADSWSDKANNWIQWDDTGDHDSPWKIESSFRSPAPKPVLEFAGGQAQHLLSVS